MRTLAEYITRRANGERIKLSDIPVKPEEKPVRDPAKEKMLADIKAAGSTTKPCCGG